MSKFNINDAREAQGLSPLQECSGGCGYTTCGGGRGCGACGDCQGEHCECHVRDAKEAGQLWKVLSGLVPHPYPYPPRGEDCPECGYSSCWSRYCGGCAACRGDFGDCRYPHHQEAQTRQGLSEDQRDAVKMERYWAYRQMMPLLGPGAYLVYRWGAEDPWEVHQSGLVSRGGTAKAAIRRLIDSKESAE